MLIPVNGFTPILFDTNIANGSQTTIKIKFRDESTNPITYTEFTNDDIASEGIQLTSYINSDNNITFGGVYSKEITINFINSSAFDSFDWTLPFSVELHISGDYIILGDFIGETPTRYVNSKVITFTAHDYIYYCDKEQLADTYIESRTYPITFRNFLQGLMNAASLTWVYNSSRDSLINYFSSTNLWIGNANFLKGVTYSRFLKQIAEINGANVSVNNRGNVFFKTIKPYNGNPRYTVSYSNIYNLNMEEEIIPAIDTIILTSPIIENNTENYIYPSTIGDNAYRIINNVFTPYRTTDCDTVCSQLLNKLSNIGSYHPMTVEVAGGTCVEAGDVIPVAIDSNGTTVNMPVFKTTLYWNGSCRCVYECTGDNNKGLTKEQQDSYELNGIIDDAINNNNNNYVSKEQGQDTFPNLTNASISPYSMLIPQGADLDTYEEPGTYICASGTDAATMSNVPPGVIANFKLIVNRNTGDGNPNWWGCQIVQSNDLIHIRKHQDASYGTWEQMGYTNVADTWAEFLAKAKARAEITFTFFGNTTVTNKLCGRSQKSYGTCMYSGGYLCWNLTTFDDYSYYGWWKESDDSIKVHLIQVPNGLVTMVYEKTGVTIPDNSTFTIDLSSDVPSGYDIYSAEIHVKYNESDWWSLPYFSDTMNQGMWIRRIVNNKITIRCSSNGWGSNNRVQVIAHMRRS